MRNSNSPPEYGTPTTMAGRLAGAAAAMNPQAYQQMQQRQGGMQPWGQIGRTQWGSQGAPPQGQPAAPFAAPPISPEAYGRYRQIAAMPVTGNHTRGLYNQAAQQFARQYGTSFDPKGVFAKTKALRRQFGGQ
jgi:hypothetical protein